MSIPYNIDIMPIYTIIKYYNKTCQDKIITSDHELDN